jgi:hypothetical protein
MNSGRCGLSCLRCLLLSPRSLRKSVSKISTRIRDIHSHSHGSLQLSDLAAGNRPVRAAECDIGSYLDVPGCVRSRNRSIMAVLFPCPQIRTGVVGRARGQAQRSASRDLWCARSRRAAFADRMAWNCTDRLRRRADRIGHVASQSDLFAVGRVSLCQPIFRHTIATGHGGRFGCYARCYAQRRGTKSSAADSTDHCKPLKPLRSIYAFEN